MSGYENVKVTLKSEIIITLKLVAILF